MAIMYYNPYKKARIAATGIGTMLAARPQPSRGQTLNRIGGGINSVITRKKEVKKRKYRTFREKVLALESAHHEVANDADLLISGATHNTIYTHNVTAQVAQGTTNYTRVGDNIHLEAIKISGFYASDSALTNGQVFRIMLFYADVQDNTGGTGFGSAVGTNKVFLDTTTGALSINGISDPKKINVIYDAAHTMNHGLSGSADVENIWINLQLQKSFTYSPGTVYGKDTNLYILFCAGTAGGATGTTDCGDLNLSYDLIFKNAA